ncbi:hypothetical protein D7V86_01575 [bacterium D16-51]|nr:hypothetical protein D7V96_01005 [bacterium D16-59]RKI62490.1 hypothetical protein D7V86_01575 [bacterium D16-51]
MDGKLNYFIFNKESDYRRGCLLNMTVEGGGLQVERDSVERGLFLSRILDSREVEMEWHRLCIRRDEKRQAAFRVSIYAGNQKSFVFRGGETDLGQFVCRGDIAFEEKLQCMLPWLQKQVTGQDDILLHGVTGRYLWFLLEIYRQQEAGKLYDIQVYFPKQSWMGYLPEIYQKEDKDSFLERYLGIFQTIYEDFNEEIRQVPQKLDMESAKGEHLAWLAEWLDIEESYIWPENQLRVLLKNGVSLYKRRGTRQGIIDFVTLYTGEPPFIVENHQIRRFKKDGAYLENLQKLYGSNPYSFTVLVREEVFHSIWQQKTLIKIIDDIKPVQMDWQLVMIKPYIFAGLFSYIGINSVLGKYSAMALDGHSAIPFVALQGSCVVARQAEVCACAAAQTHSIMRKERRRNEEDYEKF